MPDQRTAYPVSGEIMAAEKPSSDRATSSREPMRDDALDADYEVVNPVAPRETTVASPARAAADLPGGMDMLRGGDKAPAGLKRGGPLFWLLGLALVAGAFWISGGHAALTQLASGTAQDSAVLVISGVSSRLDVSGARPVLFVDGEARNDGAAPSDLPPLLILVTGHDGKVVRYNLGTSGRVLAAGENFVFSSRLDVPRNGVKSVSVTFAE